MSPPLLNERWACTRPSSSRRATMTSHLNYLAVNFVNFDVDFAVDLDGVDLAVDLDVADLVDDKR